MEYTIKAVDNKLIIETEMFCICVERSENEEWNFEGLSLKINNGVMTSDNFKDARIQLALSEFPVPILSVEHMK